MLLRVCIDVEDDDEDGNYEDSDDDDDNDDDESDKDDSDNSDEERQLLGWTGPTKKRSKLFYFLVMTIMYTV